MRIDHEPGRHQIIQITGAGMDVKDPATVTTREVVVMAVSKLKPRIFTRQLNHLQRLLLDQGFQGPINRGNAERGHATLRH
jgi:hypothetical protein